MNFGKILKDLRLEKNLTQSELAKRAELATSCIAMIETEKRDPNALTVIALAKALDVSTDYLLGRTDELGAVVMPGTSQTLSDEEQDLLRNFRTLSPDLQSVALGAVRALAGSSTKNP